MGVPRKTLALGHESSDKDLIAAVRLLSRQLVITSLQHRFLMKPWLSATPSLTRSLPLLGSDVEWVVKMHVATSEPRSGNDRVKRAEDSTCMIVRKPVNCGGPTARCGAPLLLWRNVATNGLHRGIGVGSVIGKRQLSGDLGFGPLTSIALVFLPPKSRDAHRNTAVGKCDFARIAIAVHLSASRLADEYRVRILL